MKAHLSAQKIDRFGLVARWALAPLVAAVVLDRLPFAGTAAATALYAAVGWPVWRALADEETYRRRGLVWAGRLRLADAAGVGALCLSLGEGRLFAIAAIPFILLDGYCSRDARRAAFLGVAMLAVAGSGAALGRSWSDLAAAGGAIVGATVIGLVFARFQLREYELHRRDARLTMLMETASAVAGSESLDGVIAQTLRAAVTELGASAGTISLVSESDENELVTEAAFARVERFEFPDRMRVGEGMAGFVVEMGQPVAVATEEGTVACDGIGLPARSAVAVPLVNRSFASQGQTSQEEIVGAMTLVNVERAEKVEGEDLEVLQSLASLLASAVYNSRMEERQSAIFLRTLESLATALEARDDYTRGHSQRVCEVSGMIGRRLDLHPDAIEELRIGTILHDIGKIGVPDAILNKPGRLSEEEFAVMRQHPVIGYEICRPLMLSAGVLMVIRNHHEKLDGSGYPDGLKGGELPLPLRIVCVADAFDAMSSRRPYRGVMDMRHVVSELSKGAGVQFDPVVVEALKELLFAGELDELYRSFWSVGIAATGDAPDGPEATVVLEVRRAA